MFFLRSCEYDEARAHSAQELNESAAVMPRREGIGLLLAGFRARIRASGILAGPRAKPHPHLSHRGTSVGSILGALTPVARHWRVS